MQLIEKQKLEITEITLSQVTDQYIQYLEGMENKQADELADFLVIAARLLLLKSKALLPYLEQEEELDDLEKQLKMYKEFIDASKKIQELIGQKRFTFSRQKPIARTEIEFSPPQELKVHNLKESLLIILRRLDPLVKLPRQMMEKTVSLQQTIFDIQKYLKTKGKMGFNQIMTDSKSKTEVIVNFLALLELVKQRHLKLKQTKNFEDIIIEKI